MAGDRRNTGDDAPPVTDGAAGLLREAARRLVPIVVSTGSLLTFVAFAGAVIVWTRLNAVEVAPDQAITAFPRGELVAIGASLLLLFGFFGALAVLGAFLIDRAGRPTPGMALGLLSLVAVEGIAAIVFVSGPTIEETAAALLLFLLPASFAFWAISLDVFSELHDELPARPMERKGPSPRKSILREARQKCDDVPIGEAEEDPDESEEIRSRTRPPNWQRLADVVRSVGCWLKDHADGAVYTSFTLAIVAVFTGVVLTALGVSGPSFFIAVGGLSVLYWLWAVALAVVASVQLDEARRKEQAAEREQAEKLAGKEGREIAHQLEVLRPLGSVEGPAEREAWGKEWVAWIEREGYRRQWRRALEDMRLSTKRPYRLFLNGRGMSIVVISLFIAAALPALRLNELWLGFSLAAAAVIAMWLWRIAIFTRDKLIWFGLAVFLSVPLFGTLMTMARNLDDPQIQPVALIRDTDGLDEAIQGLYVTEADKRVYFATVATEGCTGKVRPHSGRLLWVPKDELVAMSVGPLQNVEAAAKTSLEMAFALTPAVETPTGESVSLRPEGVGAAPAAGSSAEAPATVHRLENVGSAVRRTFGRGLVVEPEDAQPGEPVSLSMSTPIKDGFGDRRDGRNLRVGGAPAKIVINPTRHAYRAEYVKIEGGGRLALDKESGLYVSEGGSAEIVRYEGQSDVDAWFLKLARDTGVGRTGHEQDHELFLQISQRADTDLLVTRSVREEDGGAIRLSPKLERQAWNKDEIKFVVPEGATTGAITVDCEQLAGEPLLSVQRPPEARISARMLGSGELYVDGRRSSDDGSIRALRWKADGRSRLRDAVRAGRGRKGAVAGVVPLSRRLGVHRVQLIVEDDRREIDRATLVLARLPDPHVAFAGAGEVDASASGGATRSGSAEPVALRRVRRSLTSGMDEEPPAKAVLDAHAVDETGGRLAEKSLKAAATAHARLLTADTGVSAGLRGNGIRARVRAFGESCAFAGAGPAGDRLVDLYLMTEGVRLGMPKGCAPRRVVHRLWGGPAHDTEVRLSSPGGDPSPAAEAPGRLSTS